MHDVISDYMGGFDKIQFMIHDVFKCTDTLMCIVYDPAEENFVTALVPSDTACFANSPGSIKRTEV